jgi:hypothetical protein
MKATLEGKAKSDRLIEKFTIQAYITGLGFALSANLFISALFYFQDVGPTFFSVAELSIGLAMSFLTGILGYRALTK